MPKLKCKNCETQYPTDTPKWKCDCGGLLDIEFKPVFDLEKIKSRRPTMWRYREAIPIENDENIVSFEEGFTPLLDVDFDGRSILVKQEHLFPSGSYKDRGASVLISKVKELGLTEVVEDSSGNSGSAISAYCAKAGIDCDIIVPVSTSAGKSTQIELYGASIHKIAGSREDTANAIMKAAEEIYYASHSWNPYFFHGTKTFAFEVCEQLGWKAPDTVILPAGNGTILIGAHLGFNELLEAGIITRIPKIVAIQAANCSPLYRVFNENLDEIPEIDKVDTIAEGIAIAAPIRGKEIVEAVKKSNGEFIIVHENKIIDSLKEMCKQGYYIEPTAAATAAGIRKYLSQASSNEVVVSVFTGHGLKATEKMAFL